MLRNLKSFSCFFCLHALLALCGCDIRETAKTNPAPSLKVRSFEDWLSLMEVTGNDVPNKSLRNWHLSGTSPNPQPMSVDQSALGQLQSSKLFDGRPYKLDHLFEQAVRNAHQLEWLCLPPGATLDDLRWIGEVKQLRGLSLNGANLSGADLQLLQKLTDLQWLNLKGAELPPAIVSPLPHLPRLQVLIMDDVRPFERYCDIVGQFPSLRVLNIARTYITDDGLRKLVRANPHIQLLDISGPKRITVASIPELAKLTELKVLHIGDIMGYADELELIDAVPKLQRQLPECFIYTGD